jgi:hypothetical protein
MSEHATTAISLEQMAAALLARDAMLLRLLVQAWLRDAPPFRTLPRPDTDDPRVLTAAAALVELFALRAGQAPPAWATEAGPLPEPFFVMRRAERPGFTRDLCLAESPAPLKRRNIFAPPNFLQMV